MAPWLHRIDPIALQFPEFDLFGINFHPAVHWYGLMYALGFALAWWLGRLRIRQGRLPGVGEAAFGDLLFYGMLGVILGGRLGYILFYDLGTYLADPLQVFMIWEGGMSFHGGLIGTLAAIAWVSWRGGLNVLRVADYIAVCVPFGLFFGRLANFVNGELWGRVAGEGVPWAMIFPDAGPLPRHPSQLYEAGLEGLVLMIVLLLLFWKTRARWRTGMLTGVFALGYGLSRFTVEYFREPDSQLAEFAARTGLSMGQWLTLPLIGGGLLLIAFALIRPPLGRGAVTPT